MDRVAVPRRRSRRWIVLAAVGVVVVVLATALVSAGRMFTRTGRYGVDLVVSYGDNDEVTELWPAGGGGHLGGAIPGGFAYRVPGGWLVGDVGELYLIRTDGSQHRLLAREAYTDFVVAADGRHVAWRTGHALWAGRVAGGRVVDRRHVAAAASGPSPVLYAGTVVHLVAPDRTSESWIPGVGRWQDRVLNASLVDISAPAPDSRYVFGAVDTDRGHCLALLDPAHRLRTVRQRCLPGRAVPYAGCGASPAVSPRGTYLMVRAGRSVRVYRTASVFGSARPVATYRMDPRTSCAAWASDGALAVQADVLHRDGHRDVGWLYHPGTGRADRVRLPFRLALTAFEEQSSTNIDADVVPRLGF